MALLDWYENYPYFATLLVWLSCELIFIYTPDLAAQEAADVVAFIHHLFGVFKALK